jgi:hypothetical protein
VGVPLHNDLEGLQGGTEFERYHVTQLIAAALEAAGILPGDVFAKVGEIIKQHNALGGLQGGTEFERYHLTKNGSDAAAFSKEPSKYNPFLTRKNLPQFTRTISPFHLVEHEPENMGMLYGAAYSSYGGGLHVAVGDNCAYHATAEDPETWQAYANVPAGYWRRAVGGGLDIVVAVGLQGKIMYLDTAGLWNILPSLGGDWNDIVYGNGMFVAVGEGAIMRSNDGVTGWTFKTMPPGFGRDITFANGWFYVIGTQGMKRSADADTWEDVTLPVDATWRTMAAGEIHGIALGGKCVRTHDSGESWAERAVPIGGWEESLYVSGFFVAVDGIDSYMITEAEHIRWERYPMPNFAVRALSAGNDTIIAVGSKILVSRVIDVGAALTNANGPNGSNPFATMQDVQNAIKEATLYWEGDI